MRPTKQHLSVKEWIHPDVFKDLGIKALEKGFLGVYSLPLVRSSYRARELYEEACRKNVSTET
jgi:lipoic acid synthetase